MTNLFLYILLKHKADSGIEAIVLGLVSVAFIVIILGISSVIKKVTAKKKGAEKMK
jgi:hypothetical protein